MDSWDDTLRELQGYYISESVAKIKEMGLLLDRLARAGSDLETLRELLRHFHGLAGSGATYGFPEVSALGLEGERACRVVLDRDEGAGAREIELWREVLNLLRAEFPKEAQPETPIVPAPKPTYKPLDILVIDDDPSISKMLLKLLAQEGMAGRSASTKAEALREVSSRIPDGLIVDIVLSDGSGYELVEHVRSLPDGDRPAILVLSVRTGFLDKVDAIHCGADGFFEKPLDWDALVRRLQHLLERSRAGPSKILSVEDDPAQSAFLKAVLESAGYDVTTCDDPTSFENILSATRPDLVLMDILLPGINGYDLVRYLRQDEKHAALPVLFLSTEDHLAAQIRAARAGADDHLTKPVVPGLLLSAVAARIERARFLKGLLNRDGLTRLLTHTAFLERARAAVSRLGRNLEQAAWVMIDLDHFKAVNDAYGHPTGDRVLASLSALLRRRLRQSDTLGRYGGEEFGVVLEDLRRDEAMRLVSRLLEEFRKEDQVSPDSVPFHVTFSAGIAMLQPGMDLDQWRQAADDALYQAKGAGRNQVIALGA